MASRCLFIGHDYAILRGAGQYRNDAFAVCNRCGHTVRLGPADETTPEPRVRYADLSRVRTDAVR